MAEQGVNFVGDVSGRFSSFSFRFSEHLACTSVACIQCSKFLFPIVVALTRVGKVHVLQVEEAMTQAQSTLIAVVSCLFGFLPMMLVNVLTPNPNPRIS